MLSARTAVVAAAFLADAVHFTRERIRLPQRATPDGRMRSVADVSAAIDQLRQSLIGRPDDALLRMVLTAIVTHAHVPGALLTVEVGDRPGTVVSAGADVGAGSRAIPLVCRGERLGEVRIGDRTRHSRENDDGLLIDLLVHEAASIVYEMRRDAEIARAQQDAALLTAEVRSRVGRDLHDGIAPLLAGAGLAAEALRRGMTPGSTDEALAAQLSERLRAAAGEVRRVAHDFQPEDVDALGLVAAIEHYFAALRGPGLPELSVIADSDGTSTETGPTAYLVVLEAVNNALRHAQARHINVRISRISTGTLAVVVIDDGHGIAQPYISGLGITSMRRRVQAAGGTFSILPGGPYRATSRGTIVTVRLPIDIAGAP